MLLSQLCVALHMRLSCKGETTFMINCSSKAVRFFFEQDGLPCSSLLHLPYADLITKVYSRGSRCKSPMRDEAQLSSSVCSPCIKLSTACQSRCMLTAKRNCSPWSCSLDKLWLVNLSTGQYSQLPKVIVTLLAPNKQR
jgi:hypothetical protein